jgi:uncharacterized membrane protein
MPLSEHEERALAEIAKHLSEEDPRFVATVSNTTVASVHKRRFRWAAVGAVVGLITMLGLAWSFWLAVAGFAILLVSAVVGIRAGRALSSDPEVMERIRRRSDSERDR